MNQAGFTIVNNTVKVIAPKQEYVCSLTSPSQGPKFIELLVCLQPGDPTGQVCLYSGPRAELGRHLCWRKGYQYSMTEAERNMVGHVAPQTRPIIIKVLNLANLMEVYSVRANIMLIIWSNTSSLYRLNVNICLSTICYVITLNFGLLLQVYNRVSKSFPKFQNKYLMEPFPSFGEYIPVFYQTKNYYSTVSRAQTSNMMNNYLKEWVFISFLDGIFVL